MSFLSRALLRGFCTSAQPTTGIANAANSSNVKSLCEDIYKERNFKRLVEKFKVYSVNDRFRTVISVYEDTIRRLAAARRFGLIEEILEDQKKYVDIQKEGFNARLITLYGKSGLFYSSQKVFDEMLLRNCKRTVLSFNALLAAYINSKNFDKVLELFRKLPEQLEIEPDLVSFNTVIKAFCKMGSLDEAIAMLDEMEKKGVAPDLISFNTLVIALYSKGRFLDGERTWSRMLERNVSPDTMTYNAKMLGLALEKRTKDAVDMFEKMRNKGIKPDVISFNFLIKGFVDEGKMEEAKHWYGELGNSDCKANKFTYSTLITFACEKGDFGFAFELSKHVFDKKHIVRGILLQRLVDALARESMVEEARELVHLSKVNGFCRYNLELPSYCRAIPF